MDEVQLMLPGEIVKKDNQLVRTRVAIDGVVGGRILASLVACLKADGTTGETVAISAKKFLSDMANGSDYTKIRACVSALASSFAELVQLDTKKKDFVIKAVPFFSEISYCEGKISAKFNPSAYPLLTKLKKGFTKYNLIEFLQLPSLYSQRIFEILKSYENLDKESIEIKLIDLHRMMNCSESLRKSFKDFRRFILEKAELDINKKTTLRFSWEPIKTGRKVTAVRFTFTGKVQKRLEEVRKKEEAEKGRKELAALASQGAKRPAPAERRDGPQAFGSLLSGDDIPLEERKKRFREELKVAGYRD